jgi:hypothetical protein
VTRQKDSVTFKFRNKDLKKQFIKQRNIQIRQDGSYTVNNKGIRSGMQQLKRSGSPSKKIRYRTSQAIKNPKVTGDYLVAMKQTRFSRRFFKKPTTSFKGQVRTKQPPFKTTTSSKGQVRTKQPPFKTTTSSNGQLLILKQKPFPVSTKPPFKTKVTAAKFSRLFKTKVTAAKFSRLKDKKSLIKGDPARSQYAAQNIQADPLKVDLGNPPTTQGTTNPGFRPGVTKESIVGKDVITYLKSDLRNLRGVSLPSGNLPRSVPPRAVVLSKEGSLITGVYLPQNKEIRARSITAQPSPLLSDQGTNENVATTNTYKPAVIEATAADTDQVQDSTQIFDQSPRSATKGGSSSESSSFFKTPREEPEEPLDQVITPPTATPRTPFTQKKPRDPPTIFPRFRFNRERETAPIGYDVEARIGGIFRRISRSPLSLKEAVSFGASKVGGSSAATFRVSKSTSPIGARFFGNDHLDDFESRAGGIFVEKRDKRINTPGEIVGITRKGQAALKNRGFFGRALKNRGVFG